MSDNPSGKLVGELAEKGGEATLKIVKVENLLCGEMFAVVVPLVYEGGFLLRMTQDTTYGGMRTPSLLNRNKKIARYKFKIRT